MIYFYKLHAILKVHYLNWTILKPWEKEIRHILYCKSRPYTCHSHWGGFVMGYAHSSFPSNMLLAGGRMAANAQRISSSWIWLLLNIEYLIIKAKSRRWTIFSKAMTIIPPVDLPPAGRVINSILCTELTAPATRQRIKPMKIDRWINILSDYMIVKRKQIKLP